MRVLHAQRASGVSGSERHLLALLPALMARGHDVHAVVLERPGGEAFTAELAAAGVPAVGVPVGRVGARSPDAIASLARRLRPDILHTHLIHADAAGVLASRAAGAVHVSSVHSTFAGYRRRTGRSVATLVGRTAARTIAISEHVARFVIDSGIAPSERVRVVRYGLDLTRWTPGDQVAARAEAGLPPDDVVLLVASRLVSDKGHDAALRAVARVAEEVPGLRLLVAGDGPLRAQLEQLARMLGIENRVTFLGFVPDVPLLVRASDVVLFPTGEGFGEGFGMVNLEAMALARPVVGSRVASVPEIVCDGETGLLVPPDDEVALAAAITRLAADPMTAREMGAAGRRRAEALFSLERMVTETEAVYREVVPG